MLLYIIKEMRVKQYTKNLFIYAALLFSGNIFNIEDLKLTTEVFSLNFGIYFK